MRGELLNYGRHTPEELLWEGARLPNQPPGVQAKLQTSALLRSQLKSKEPVLPCDFWCGYGIISGFDQSQIQHYLCLLE